MKEIPLTQGKIALIDDEDFELISQFKWYAAKYRNTFYAQREQIREDGSRTCVKLHQLLLPPKVGYVTDHKDGNGLDCQRSNLRYASNLQNGFNKRKKTPKSRGRFKGVCWANDRQKWRACIRVNWRLIHLGQFDDEKIAALAYNNAAIEHFGEFAALNKI